jgi:hypothetical protein
MNSNIIQPTNTDGSSQVTDLIKVCHDCGQTLRIFYQPGLLPDHPGYDQAECENRECLLYKTTLTPDRLAGLTDAERESYREMRRGEEARAKLDMARCLLASREYVRRHPLKKVG